MVPDSHQLKRFVKHFFTAKRKGHGVHSPFAYQLCENVFYNEDHFYAFEALNRVRTDLLKNNTSLEIEDLGAGSRTFKGTRRKIKDIAAKGISSKKQSEIIYRLMNYLNCTSCVELGTSVGLNTLYMASVNKQAKIISVEGSKALCDLAKDLAKEQSLPNIEFVNGPFKEAVPVILKTIQTLDLLYVDGDHTYESTLNYFQQFLTKASNETVFIFDDIYWSPGMTKAWNEIKDHASVRMSIDLFYFGMVFFKSEIKEKVELRLYI